MSMQIRARLEDNSPLLRDDFLAQRDDEFQAALDAKKAADTAAQIANGEFRNLRAAHAHLEAEADRTAREAMKGRCDEQTPKDLAAQADALAADQLAKAEAAAEQANRAAAEATAAVGRARSEAQSRILTAAAAAHHTAAEKFGHALGVLMEAAEEAEAARRGWAPLGIDVSGPPVALTSARFQGRWPGGQTYDGTGADVAARLRSYGVEFEGGGGSDAWAKEPQVVLRQIDGDAETGRRLSGI